MVLWEAKIRTWGICIESMSGTTMYHTAAQLYKYCTWYIGDLWVSCGRLVCGLWLTCTWVEVGCAWVEVGCAWVFLELWVSWKLLRGPMTTSAQSALYPGALSSFGLGCLALTNTCCAPFFDTWMHIFSAMSRRVFYQCLWIKFSHMKQWMGHHGLIMEHWGVIAFLPRVFCTWVQRKNASGLQDFRTLHPGACVRPKAW
jgi:hypothetical protein